MERALFWTDGHPYLTQRLCRAITETPEIVGPAQADRLCESLFLWAGLESLCYPAARQECCGCQPRTSFACAQSISER